MVEVVRCGDLFVLSSRYHVTVTRTTLGPYPVERQALITNRITVMCIAVDEHVSVHFPVQDVRVPYGSPRASAAVTHVFHQVHRAVQHGSLYPSHLGGVQRTLTPFVKDNARAQFQDCLLYTSDAADDCCRV